VTEPVGVSGWLKDFLVFVCDNHGFDVMVENVWVYYLRKTKTYTNINWD